MALTPSWPGVNGLATTTDGRKAVAGLIVKNAAGVPRSGVFPRHANALVTARADMNLDLGIFEAAGVQFGGPVLCSNDAVAQLPSLLVSPGVGIVNYYVVYAKQNENTAGGTDGNTNRVLGTVLSTVAFANARATGTRMDGSGTGLPTGAVELGTVEMPNNKTATNQGGVIITPTHLFTAAAGGVVQVRNTTELTAWTPMDGSDALDFNSKILYRRIAGAWKAAQGPLRARMKRSTAPVTIPDSSWNQDLSVNANWVQDFRESGIAAYANGWTIPVAGEWEIDFGVALSGAGAIGLTVNKATVTGYADFIAHASGPSVQAAGLISGSKRMPLAAGDVIRLFGVSGGPGGAAWSVVEASSWFGIRLIGPTY